MVSSNKFLQSDQVVLSCLLQKAQKTRQHDLAAEEKRYMRWEGVCDVENSVVCFGFGHAFRMHES